jgi:hypothetical protein
MCREEAEEGETLKEHLGYFLIVAAIALLGVVLWVFAPWLGIAMWAYCVVLVTLSVIEPALQRKRQRRGQEFLAELCCPLCGVRYGEATAYAAVHYLDERPKPGEPIHAGPGSGDTFGLVSMVCMNCGATALASPRSSDLTVIHDGLPADDPERRFLT